MLNTENPKSALYDPDLPTASAVMASLCCVATQYAKAPSLGLATLASSLAYTLTAPEYAETQLITTVAKRLICQWESVVLEHKQLELQQLETVGIATSTRLQ
ncbi:MAG: hypothetical protein ACT4OH_00185 [Methylophilaceae bacterium]